MRNQNFPLCFQRAMKAKKSPAPNIRGQSVTNIKKLLAEYKD